MMQNLTKKQKILQSKTQKFYKKAYNFFLQYMRMAE